MRPHNDPRNQQPLDDEVLGRAWDSLLGEADPSIHPIDPQLQSALDLIQQVHSLDDAPPPDPDLIASIWKRALVQVPAAAGTEPLGAVEIGTVHRNGKHAAAEARVVEIEVSAQRLEVDRLPTGFATLSQRKSVLQFASFVRSIVIAFVAGVPLAS
jgi:hypothetical protein